MSAFFASRAFALVSLAALVGCSGESGPGDGDACTMDHCVAIDAHLDTAHDGGVDTISDAVVDCRDSGVCASGTYCDPSNGRCVADRGPCTTDNDCENDSHCVGGRCIPYAPGGSNSTCTRPPVPAFLAPAVLCTSPQPTATDPFPTFVSVSPSLVAADFQFRSGLHPSIVAVFGVTGEGRAGVIRVYDGATCALQYVLDGHVVEQDSSATIGDLDGDGRPEIIASSYPDARTGIADADDGGLVAFRYDDPTDTWRLFWRSHDATGAHDTYYSGENWNSPSLADLDDDGLPEIIYGTVVYDHTGLVLDGHLYAGNGYSVGTFGVTADVDNDAHHTPELITGTSIYAWDVTTHQWSVAPYWTPSTPLLEGQVAVADFGDFPGTVHGDPEIAVITSGTGRVQTRYGQVVFGPIAIPGGGTGGPPTAADFNGDHQVDFATAALARYVVFDLTCVGTPLPAGCESAGIRWARPNQDASSNVTGSSVFDFNGDGAAEAVYADECFTRVFDGTTGTVLFSRYRSSGTWYEYPIVLDVNGDLKAEIAIGANLDAPACTTLAPGGYDSTFPGLGCSTDADCPSTSTHCDSGLCRCTADSDCGDPGYGCRAADTGSSGTGNVCRALVGTPFGGFQVFGDPHGRWTPSRPIWNEHTYSITNVSDTGTIPASHARLQNWLVPGLNDFRQNTQGSLSPDAAPDLTAGPGTAGTCMMTGPTTATVTLSSPVCNRGTAPVASGVAVAFEVAGGDASATVACTATTSMTLAPGDCETVMCTWTTAMPGAVYEMVVIPDPMHNTLECLTGNDDGSLMGVDCSTLG